MRITQIIFGILFFLLPAEILLAQSSTPALPNVVPPSPDAQSLGKFGDIPVGEFTGVPDISIPVYEIKIGDFSLPIALRYHASGIKVEEVASSVGTGWALDAGGMINQSVYGRNDLEGEGFPGSQYRLPNHSLTSPIQFYSDSLFGGYDYDYARKVSDGTSDSQPDLFYYSFCGFSGKFYIDQDGQVHTIPFDPLQIQYNISGLVRYKFTDKNGNQYFFASGESSTTTELCGTSVGGSIYLDKILLNNHDSIVFEYEPVNYSYNIHSTEARAVAKPGEGSIGIALVVQNLDCYGGNLPATVDVAGIRIKRISTTRGQVVEFTYGLVRDDLTGSNSLTGISIKYKSTPVKSYSLYQSYFIAGSASGPEYKRLKLDSVISGDQIYRLNYNQTVNLPERLSFAQDHWGFYNGQSANSTLLPVDFENGFTGGANREVDTAYVKAGILEKIEYPTGGFTKFDYEPNDYHFTGTQTTITPEFQLLVGGVNNTVTKTFTIPASPIQIINARAILVANPFAALGSLDNAGADPLCEIHLTGDNGYSQGWSNQNSPDSGFGLTLPPGNYTMTVQTFDDYTNDNNPYLKVQYDQVVTTDVDRNDFIGGLRIKAVTSYASAIDQNPVVKTYKYAFPDTHFSSGQINFKPSYIAGITYTVATYTNPDGPSLEPKEPTYVDFANHNYWRQSSNSVFPLGTIHGGSVGYTYVESWEGANAENGKTISTYSFLSDGGGSSTYPLVPTVSRDWNSGYLLEEDIYKNNGAGFSLLHKKNNFYSDHSESEYWNEHYNPSTFNSNDYLRGWGVSIIYKHPEYIFGAIKFPAEFYWNDFHLLSRWVRLDSTVEQVYDPGNSANFVQTKTAQSYNNLYNLQPTTTTTTNSKGETVEHFTSYPNDAISGLSTTASAAQSELVNRWQILRPLEEITKKNGTVVTDTRNNYFITPDNNVLLGSVQMATLANPLDTRVVFNKYDRNGNFIDMQKASDMKQIFIWDYSANYPIAKCINTDSGSFAYTSFEAEGTGNWVVGSGSVDATAGITGNNSYVLTSDVGSYISKSGLNSATTYIVSYWTENDAAFSIAGTISGYPVKGKTVSLNGHAWTLYVHKVSGQTTITVSGSGNIDELRLYPATAQMTTYTYSPLIGMTSQCDSGNRITYYEYDGLARLKLVRDQDYNILKTYDYQYQVPGGN
jgi:hypothetical protein